jgi:hydroxymethylglutaryl-CoA lyase
VAALDVGIRRFDSSLAGLGGCPFAPKATGNIVTEDLVYLCETMGFATSIDLDKLIALRELISRALPDERQMGMIAKAGLPKNYHDAVQLSEAQRA